MQIKVIVNKGGYTMIAVEEGDELGSVIMRRRSYGLIGGGFELLAEQLENTGTHVDDMEILYEALQHIDAGAKSVMQALARIE